MRWWPFGAITSEVALEIARAEAERRQEQLAEPVSITREGLRTWLVRGRCDQRPGGPWIRVDAFRGTVRAYTWPPR